MMLVRQLRRNGRRYRMERKDRRGGARVDPVTGEMLSGGPGKPRMSTRKDPKGEKRSNKTTLTYTDSLKQRFEPLRVEGESDRDFLEVLVLIALDAIDENPELLDSKRRELRNE